MNAIEFHLIEYSQQPHPWVSDLYGLRKQVFADRLNWKVAVRDGIELDEYDNPHTRYLIGVHDGIPIAGLRLINTAHPYMVEGPFRGYFDCEPPKDVQLAESSRFFVDKRRSRDLGLAHLPMTEMLLFAMHEYASACGLRSIITVVSDAMGRIVRNAGWHYEVMSAGEASPGEKVLLLDMPVSELNQLRLAGNIKRKQPLLTMPGSQWPLRLYLQAHLASGTA